MKRFVAASVVLVNAFFELVGRADTEAPRDVHVRYQYFSVSQLGHGRTSALDDAGFLVSAFRFPPTGSVYLT